jgi:uncharacterized membrane protein
MRNSRFTERSATRDSGERLAKALGWFGIGLGLAEIAAPGRVARLIGVRDEDGTRSLLRFYGVREIASGAGILTQPRPAAWMWGRVGGDMLDLATLASAMQSPDASRTRTGAVTAAVLGVTALDVMCARQLSETSEDARKATRARASIAINRSPEELYRFWRDFENLPRFMPNLESVRHLEGGRSRWKAKAIAGTTVEWDAEIVEDQPNSLVSWRSLEGATVRNSGSVRFRPAPGDRGTIVTVEVEYDPPGGSLAAGVAKMFGSDPGQQITQDLRAFKQIIETGEVAKSDASIHRGMHPGRPSVAPVRAAR